MFGKFQKGGNGYDESGICKMEKQRPNPETNFNKSFEEFGGYVEKIEIGKGYYEGLRH